NNSTTPEAKPSALDAHVPRAWQKKGPSPNPKGRYRQPKSVGEVKQLARSFTVQSIRTLAAIAGNSKAPFAARQAAASAILDRGWGKPAAVDFEGSDGLIIKVLKFGEEPETKTIEHRSDSEKVSRDGSETN